MSHADLDLQIQPYIDAGLTRPFAEAIVKGTDFGEVLDLWEQDWWKQYDDNDPLLLAVLSGQVTQENGKWLNDIRSDHQNLVMMYLQGEITFEWAQALMETPFSEDPEAVEFVLRGAIPEVIARMRNLDNSGGDFPHNCQLNPTNRRFHFQDNREILELRPSNKRRLLPHLHLTPAPPQLHLPKPDLKD